MYHSKDHGQGWNTSRIATDDHNQRIGLICQGCKKIVHDGQFYIAEEQMRQCKMCKRYYCEECIETNEFFQIDVCHLCWQENR
jgi:hypothetical protein